MNTIRSQMNPIYINVLENLSYLYPYVKICTYLCIYVSYHPQKRQSPTLSLTSALDGCVGGKGHAPAALPAGDKPVPAAQDAG